MTRPIVRWPVVALLCATATSSYICRVNVSTAGVWLMREFDLSQVQLGNIFSIFLLGYAFMQLPAGILADKIGARKVLMFSALSWFLLTAGQVLPGSFLLPLGSSFWVLATFMTCRLLLGIAEAPTYPSSAEGIARWIPSTHQGRANGVVIASIGLGSAITPVLVSNIMVNSGWRWALFVSGIPALVMAVIWFIVSEPPSVVMKEAKHSASYGGRLFSKDFVLLTLSYTLQGYVGYIFVSWFYIYLVQERHFGILEGAWFSSLPWILTIVSIPLGGLISDRLVKRWPLWGVRVVPMLGMAASGVLISAGAHTENAIFAAISLAFATAFVLSVEGPFWATMIRLCGNRSGSAGGTMNMGSNIGGLISPALTPWLATKIGWENALHLAAGLALLGAFLWLGIRARKTTDGDLT